MRTTFATETPMTTASSAGSVRKDTAICGAIFAGASMMWFGWGQQGGELGGLLVAGSLVAITVTALAALNIRRTPGRPTLSVDPRARGIYWGAVLAEVIAIVGSAALLNRAGHPAYLSSVTLAIVGLHFLPMMRAFRIRLLGAVAMACVLIGGAAAGGGLLGWWPAPTAAGLGGGLALLVAGVGCILGSRR